MNRENRKFQVAAVQMDCVRYQKAANLKTAEALVGEAAQGGAKIIALPELFNTGYCVADADFTLAEPIPTGETTLWMESLCKQYGVFLTGAIIERDSHEGVLYDTHLLVGPEGYVGKYRKVCLWGDEQLRFREGSAYPVFDLGFAKVGLQICYEVGFPESARILALRGANLLIYSAAFGRARSYVWELASRARLLRTACMFWLPIATALKTTHWPLQIRAGLFHPGATFWRKVRKETPCCLRRLTWTRCPVSAGRSPICETISSSCLPGRLRDRIYKQV